MGDSNIHSISANKTVEGSPTLNSVQEKKDTYGPWMIVECRHSRKKVTSTKGVLEQMEAGQKQKESHERIGLTRKTSSKIQPAIYAFKSNQPNDLMVKTFNVEPSQSKVATATNPKPISNTLKKMDPKSGQWIAKDQVNRHDPTKAEA
ncbi:hypothetical protein SLE2022_052480 [Rubroshorea leprosula]